MTDNELTLTYIDGLMRGREEAAEHLAAAQAREAQLRESVDAMRAVSIDGMFKGRHIDIARTALALLADDTALKARLKAERERVIALCDSSYWNDAGDLIRAIRTLGDE